MTFLLCGTPNCGKTTLFNLLTGQSQRTGNWPGVTVQAKSAYLSADYLPPGLAALRIVDLPGMVSCTPHSPDEAAALNALQKTDYDALIVVIDSCAPAQGLYLALQLMTLRRPMLLALNMADRLHALGGSIDTRKLSRMLHVPCLSFSARKRTHISSLIFKALQTHTPAAALVPFEPQASRERCAAWAVQRWRTVDQLLESCFSLPEHAAVSALDHIALHPLFSWPMLFCVAAYIFFFAFGIPGQILSQWLSTFFSTAIAAISQLLFQADTPVLLRTFLTQGLLRSMAGVLSFLPTLLLFFFATALMEDSGYFSRAAFLLDAPLRRIGLSGRSFFPLITGCSCSVPAILSTQSLSDSHERSLSSRLIPFIPCSAKLPVILFLATQLQLATPLIFTVSYALCIGCALLLAFMLKTSPSAPPLLSDMPAYHLPSLRSAWHLMQQKARDFLSRACTVIFFTAIVVWLLQSFTPALQFTQDVTQSLLYRLSTLILPFFRPLGLSSPLCAAALLAGLMAKENILSVLLLNADNTLFSSRAAAFSFLAFSLLYAPCTAACAALSQALKSRKRMLCAVLFQTAFAWLAAWAIYQFLSR